MKSIYRLNFVLMDSFGWDADYIEGMRMFEYEIYVAMLNERVKKEEAERKRH